MSKSRTSHRLWELVQELRARRFVDLTHAFGPGIPHAPDMPNEERVALYTFEKDGFRTHRYSIVGQWGTHVDPPSHFIEHGRTLDQVGVHEMVLPLAVLDVVGRVEEDPDYVITVNDIRDWEARNGLVPRGAFVALRTGWAERWPEPDRVMNKDAVGVCHFPGWSTDALEFLCEERDLVACGHETPDTDPGVVVSADSFPAETYVLSQGKYQIELLANLHKVPEVGAIAVATFPKPAGGSGFPARVFAIT